MIGIDYLTKGLEFFNSLVGELDKRRLIDYGEKTIEVERYEYLNKLINRGLAVKRDVKSKGAFDDGYCRD